MGKTTDDSPSWTNWPSASGRVQPFSAVSVGLGQRVPLPAGSALFDTQIGRCGIAWGPKGILAVQLPDISDAATRLRLQRGLSSLPPAPSLQAVPQFVLAAIDGIQALMRGEARDLRELVLDMERIAPFHQRVYEIARTIDPGKTLTYGEIAQRLELPGSARAVGQALGSNPFVIVVPCHRVLAAGGKSGGFSAPGGTRTKLRLLAIEGAFRQPPSAGDSFPLF